MGIILSTINTFFGIINTLFMIINILVIGGLILAAVYIGPKIKNILEGYNAYKSLTAKLSDASGNKCLTYVELEEFKKKIAIAKDNLAQIKNLPGIGGLIPSDIDSLISEITNNIPICS